jgi:PAS domain-containing protein
MVMPAKRPCWRACAWGNEWYVVPGRRAEFRRLLERDGFVRSFVSEIRPKGSDRHIWVSENAHVVRDADGRVLYYEGTFEDITAQVLAQQACAAAKNSCGC